LTNPTHVYKVYSKTIDTGCKEASGESRICFGEVLYMRILRRLPISTTRPIRSIIVFVCLLIISNCTTLVADVNFNVAWGPQPANNATNVHYKTPDGNSITLSWQPGDLAKQHDVYFGTSFADVNSATTASAEYKGSRYDANGNPRNWTIANFNFKMNTELVAVLKKYFKCCKMRGQ